MTEKDIGIVVALPPEVKAWVDEQAEAEGLQAATWLRMQVFRMRRKAEPVKAAPLLQTVEPEGAEPLEASTDLIDISAMVEDRLAEAPQADAAKAGADDDIDLDAMMRRQMRVRPLRLPPDTRRLEGTSGLSTIQRVAVVGGG